MAGKNSKKVEQVEAPAKSGGASTLFVLILFVLVGIGCGVAFQHLIEKMEGSNAKLIGQISSLQEELASVKESYAAINFENEIASIGQMKEDLQQTRVQMNTGAEKVSQLKDGLSVVTTSLESLSKDVHEARDIAIATDTKMNTGAEKVSQLKDGLSVVKTSLESLSKDVHEARDIAKTTDSKVAGALDQVGALSAAVEQLSASTANSELAEKLAQAETALAAQAGATAERINAVESGLAAQISAATQAAVEAKQSAEESKTAAAGLHDQIEAAFGDDLELVKQNLASVIDARNAEAGKQAELAQQLAAAVSGSAEVSAQLATLQSGLNAVEKNTDDQGKALQEAVRSLESKANRLNANIKMTSNEVAGIKELVTNMVADNEPATEAPPMNEE